MEDERTEKDKIDEEAGLPTDEQWKRFCEEVVDPTIRAVEERQRRQR